MMMNKKGQFFLNPLFLALVGTILIISAVPNLQFAFIGTQEKVYLPEYGHIFCGPIGQKQVDLAPAKPSGSSYICGPSTINTDIFSPCTFELNYKTIIGIRVEECEIDSDVCVNKVNKQFISPAVQPSGTEFVSIKENKRMYVIFTRSVIGGSVDVSATFEQFGLQSQERGFLTQTNSCRLSSLVGQDIHALY